MKFTVVGKSDTTIHDQFQHMSHNDQFWMLMRVFPRDELRAVARRFGVKRGRNASDTAHNLLKSKTFVASVTLTLKIDFSTIATLST